MQVFLYSIEVLFFVTIYISSYFWNWVFQLSLYGCVITLYFIIQLITSRVNHHRYATIMNTEPASTSTILLVVGHRENPDYWRACLTSIVDLDAGSVSAVYIVVDGINEEDKPMYDAAMEFFRDRVTPFTVSIDAVPKRGKRGVMAFGFQKIRYDRFDQCSGIDVVVTDSDTILATDSVTRLRECLRSDPRNGCATGSLYIFNKANSLLARIIEARYIYAFQVERACASYFGCMACCSGPLSIYRLDVLNDNLLQRFVSQRFLGIPCEPGDDRHLTNLVMAEGFYSRQTSLSTATTEAPEVLFRYILQQLRWNRSFYRELKWQIQSMPKQSIMLHFMSIYELTFPWFVLSWALSVVFYHRSVPLLLKSLVISLVTMLVRSGLLSALLFTNLIYYAFLYYILYFTVLLPLKVFAFATVVNNTWVTPSRDKRFSCLPSCSWDARLAIVVIIGWNITVGYGLIRLWW
jgi:hypothetical protein